MGRECSRRDFLKKSAEVLGYGAMVASGLAPIGCDKEVDTKKRYGNWAYSQAIEQDLPKIRKLNEDIDRNPDSQEAHGARKILEDFYIDPILQEWKNLQREGHVQDELRLGDYKIKVIKHKGPVYIVEAAKYSDVVVKIDLFKDGEQIDLSFWPWSKSMNINLYSKDWSINNILDDRFPIKRKTGEVI